MNTCSTYIDDIKLSEWVEGEMLDVLSVQDHESIVTASVVDGKTVYDVEGVGLYSCGRLIRVRDVETVGAEAVDPYDIYGG